VRFRRRTAARFEIAIVFRITTDVGTIRALLYISSASDIRTIGKITVVVRIATDEGTIRALLYITVTTLYFTCEKITIVIWVTNDSRTIRAYLQIIGTALDWFVFFVRTFNKITR